MDTSSDSHHLPALVSYGFFIVSIFHNVANQLTQLQCDLQKASVYLPLSTYRELQSQLNFVAEVIRHSQDIISREQPQWQPFALAPVLWKTKHLCSAVLLRQQIRCRVQCPAHLTLYADPVILQQILLNLLHNSVQAMEKTPVVNRVIQLKAWASPTYLSLSIQDSGPGMAGSQVSQVGEPFHTAHCTCGGHGLGLAYVKHQMETNFHGQCQITSTPGEGTMVTLIFPRRENKLSAARS